MSSIEIEIEAEIEAEAETETDRDRDIDSDRDRKTSPLAEEADAETADTSHAIRLCQKSRFAALLCLHLSLLLVPHLERYPTFRG